MLTRTAKRFYKVLLSMGECWNGTISVIAVIAGSAPVQECPGVTLYL